jgi:hypothetical protein
MHATAYPHVILDDHGVLRTVVSWYKARLLIEAYLGGTTPEELVESYELLTMAESHAAIAYYWDHKAALDAEIAELKAFAEELKRTTADSPGIARLRQLKRERGDWAADLALIAQAGSPADFADRITFLPL